MDADDHEAVTEALLERSQLLDDPQAVDAAERPEIEHDDTAAEVAQREWMVGVDPSAGAAKLRCANASECRRHEGSIIPRGGLALRRTGGDRQRRLGIMPAEVGWGTGQRRRGGAGV